jgi:hypothetical protein
MLFMSASLGSVAAGVSVVTIVLAAYLLLRLNTTNAEYWKRIGAPKLLPWLWRTHNDELDDSITTSIARLVKILVVLFFAVSLLSLLLHYVAHR